MSKERFGKENENRHAEQSQNETLIEETKKTLDRVQKDESASGGISRRTMLSAMGVGALGLALPYVGNLPEVNGRRSIDQIDGDILGDDFSIAHRWRDHRLSFNVSNTPTVTKDVVIVGGGVAGLVSAWRLQKAGCKNFMLLERSKNLGGMAHSGQSGSRKFPWGAHYVDPPDRENKGLCKLYEDLKVILGYHPKDQRPICDPAHIVKPPHRNILAGGQWRRGLFPWHIATDHDRRCMAAFGDEMEYWSYFRDKEGRRGFGFPIDQCSKDSTVRGLDKISMLAYLRDKDWTSRLLLWLINDRCIDEFSLPIEKISAWAGIQYFASVVPLPKLPPAPGFPHDPVIDQMDPSDRQMSWPEGNAFLVKGILKHLPSDSLQTSKMAVHIKHVEDGVHVTYLDTKSMQSKTVKARYVLYAAPKYTVYHCIPELRGKRNEFKEVLYVPWIVGNVQCRRPPSFPKGFSMAWENNRFQSWCQGYINPQHQTEPELSNSRERLSSPMILSFYACLAYQPTIERRELLSEGWDFWARQMIDEFERMHPTLPRDIERVDIYRWGHAMHGPKPGYLFDGIRDAMRKPHGRIFFSQSDTAGLAVFEQVVVRGIEVAEQVMQKLQHPFQTYT